MEGISSESSRERRSGRAGGRQAVQLGMLTFLLQGNGGQVVAEHSTVGNGEEFNKRKPQTASLCLKAREPMFPAMCETLKELRNY